MRTETANPVRLSDYRPSAYAIDTVDLHVALDEADTLVTATLALRRRDGTPSGAPLRLDGDELVLVQLALDGVPLPGDAYATDPDGLVLHAPPEDPFRLTIVTRLDPAANTKLMGLYRSSGTWCTQCEAEGFRRITYFLDRPDVLAVYTVRMEAPKALAPVLLSNGNRVEAGDLPDGRHYAVWHDPWPKPSYLFALVAGDLAARIDGFTTASGRPVELGIYVEHGNETRIDYAMDALKRSMRWDEEVFGREYDLDVFNIVAVSDFNMGAMENKGLNVFNDKYVLADPDVATDTDYAGIEAVIAHEYFHNWTGNRITCRDWFQLCLKEGLTVFRDQEFTSDMRSRPVKRIADVRTLRSHQFPEDGGPLAHPVRPEVYKEINNFYTATVYEKGAEVIRMLKTLVGDDAFRAGMDLYFDRHDGDAATMEDFVACFAEASGRDLSAFMHWYSQAGTPTVEIAEAYDPSARTYRLTFTQTVPPTPGQPVKQPAVIPVRFGLVGSNGADMTYASVSGAEVRDDVIALTETRHEVVFTGVSERPVPSLFRGFSAPVKPQIALTPSDLTFLMRHDGDPFNRWQAASTLAMTMLVAGSEAARSGVTPRIDPAYLDALDETIADGTLDPAFRALMLAVPGENDVAREIGENVDPDAIATAHRTLRAAIGARLETTLAHIVSEASEAGDVAYTPDAAGAGRRSLVNAALDLLAATGRMEVLEAVERRFDLATNMTDRVAALSMLVHRNAPGAEAALGRFHDRFGSVPLVVDKWLAVQATAPDPSTLDRVRGLTRHPSFSFRNPNRTRSLIGSFANLNPTQFARPDGAGFDFVADVVLLLDGTNPQVAARIVTSFRSWRSYEARRRAKAEAALKRIAGKPTLSRDVSDIVERALA
ncbi:aminopeptidase N [Chthonobacter rhizosphaerae]|uniref:aminopeptidase N n=1 Tax=Chthonobacter rhizosphaerae TaxID=2735553 RepID=UPI0015EF4FA4|nr:aminopeptidase N [Chthonobacter rhizosphaerae]